MKWLRETNALRRWLNVMNEHAEAAREEVLHDRSHVSLLEILWVSTRLGLTSFGGPIAHLGYFH